MARTDNDTWDLASSVGATATMVAAARAMASPGRRSADRRSVRRTAGTRGRRRRLHPPGHRRSAPADLGGDAAAGMERMADNMAVRTVFFDDFFLRRRRARRASRQAVILASGLDARAYRLAWPPGTVVFEIDQPEVIEFKTRDAGRSRRRAHRRPPDRRRRPARRLAGRTEGGGLRSGASRPRGAPRACSATCRPTRRTGCSTPSPRSAPRAAGSPPRARPTPDPADEATGCASACRRSPSTGASTASTSTSPNSSTSATATRRRRTWPSRGWQPSGSTLQRTVRRARPRRRSTTRTWPASPTSRTSAATLGRAIAMSALRRRQLGPGLQCRRDGDHGRRRRGRWPSAEPEPADPRPLRRAAGPRRRHRLLHQAGRRRDLDRPRPTTAEPPG